MSALHKYLRLARIRLLIALACIGFCIGFWLMALGGWGITYIFFGFGFEDYFKFAERTEQRMDSLLGRPQ